MELNELLEKFQAIEASEGATDNSNEDVRAGIQVPRTWYPSTERMILEYLVLAPTYLAYQEMIAKHLLKNGERWISLKSASSAASYYVDKLYKRGMLSFKPILHAYGIGKPKSRTAIIVTKSGIEHLKSLQRNAKV